MPITRYWHAGGHPCSHPLHFQMEHDRTHVKCVVVGDGGVGKSCLLLRHMTNSCRGEYIPTIFDNYSAHVTVGGENISLELYDTSGQPTYASVRPMSYPQTDVILVCFSLVTPASLQHVQELWIPEIGQHCPDIPYLLVGMKCDLRPMIAECPEESIRRGLEVVPSSSGSAMRRAIGARPYVECSAKMNINMKDVFERAVRVVLAGRPPRQPAAASSESRRSKLPSFL
jgi:Ras-related C3 botulinum toxin substrate 1